MRQILKSLLFGKLMSFGSKKMQSLTAKTNMDDLKYLLNLTAEGKITPLIEKKYPFEKVEEAMLYISEGHASGKIIIHFNERK